MKKKLLSLLVALVLCFTLLPTASFASTGGHSQSDAVNWAYDRGNEGWAVDYDGAASVQCVDLIKAYYDYLGNGPVSGNAEDYTWNSLPNGWSRIRYYSGFEPQAGDIVVWDSTFCEYGHVAIALYTENGIVGCAETRNVYAYPNNYRCHFWEYGVSSIWGVIRPDFSSASTSVNYTSVAEGTYTIYSALDNGKCLDVAGGSTADGANIILYQYEDARLNKFKIVKEGNGYNIVNTVSGKCIDVDNSDSTPGTNVQQWSHFYNEAQRWYFEDAGNGYYYIRSEVGTYLDSENGGSGNGNNIWAYSFNGSDAQKFKLTKASAASTASVTFGPWSGNNTTSPYVGETDAIIGQTITISSGDPSDSGIYLYDANGKQVASGSNGHLSTWWGYVYFKINEECHYVLTPGTTYKYKFYVVLNGKTYWSDEGSFKTTGTAPVNYAVSLNRSNLAMKTGESSTLAATVSPTGTSVAWSSSNPSVATVSNGKVTAVGAGTATITAKVGDKTATCTVSVTAANVAVSGVTLSQSSLTLKVGDTTTLAATIDPSTATDKTVAWNSSDTSIATVSGGKITAVKTGAATITATASGKSASCTVTVSEKAIVPKITTTSVNNGAVKSSFNQVLTASGSTPITWAVSSGTLPAGLTLSTGGAISGIPVAAGTSSFTVTATNSAGTDTKSYSMTIKEEIKVGEKKDVHFPRVKVYHQDQFTDVKANQWFTDTVASAFELGLMKGNSATTFSPYGDVTIAEAITMAARIHSANATGSADFVQSGQWYQVYLDYAYQNGIIDYAYYNSDVNQKATRAQFAEIFANSLPAENLYAINSISDNAVPDVPMSANYADGTYKLYRAGILTGSDATGKFNPQTYITRAEAATIAARMAESNNRVSFSLKS